MQCRYVFGLLLPLTAVQAIHAVCSCCWFCGLCIVVFMLNLVLKFKVTGWSTCLSLWTCLVARIIEIGMVKVCWDVIYLFVDQMARAFAFIDIPLGLWRFYNIFECFRATKWFQIVGGGWRLRYWVWFESCLHDIYHIHDQVNNRPLIEQKFISKLRKNKKILKGSSWVLQKWRLFKN